MKTSVGCSSAISFSWVTTEAIEHWGEEAQIKEEMTVANVTTTQLHIYETLKHYEKETQWYTLEEQHPNKTTYAIK